MLGSLEQLGRNEPSQERLEQRLAAVAIHEPPIRQSERELEHFLVEQWRPRFQAVRHGGDIHLGHQAVREVGLHVDQPHPAQRRAIAVLVQLRQPGAHGIPAVLPLPQQVSGV